MKSDCTLKFGFEVLMKSLNRNLKSQNLLSRLFCVLCYYSCGFFLVYNIIFSIEIGKKHRKHRAPVCIAGKTSDDVTLLRGKRAGNFTNIGDVGDFEMCIKRCCQHQKCDLAFKSAETCFLVNCFSKESCQTSPSLDDIFSPRMCFVTRHLKDDEKGNQELH